MQQESVWRVGLLIQELKWFKIEMQKRKEGFGSAVGYNRADSTKTFTSWDINNLINTNQIKPLTTNLTPYKHLINTGIDFRHVVC